MTSPHRFSVSADHPVLAGHFPGNPVVPASMLLDEVIAAWATPCRGIRSAKFHRPLRGDCLAQIDFETGTHDDRVRFFCRRGEDLICSGELMTGVAE